MKKLVCSAIVVGLASMSVFGQGYMIFSSGTANGLYDIFDTPGTPTKNANMQVGFIWTAGTGATLTALGSSASPTAANSTVPNLWANLTVANLLSSGWQWGTNAATSVGVFTPTAGAPPPAAGDFSGGTIGILGTSASEAVTMYVIAWNKALSTTPAGSGPLGWSVPFNYTFGSSTLPGVSLASAFASFGVDPVPEPSTLVLAGLGGLSLLLFRRRK